MSTERPDTVHGRLMESVHLSGYSFERACSELNWLLDEDRWKQCGDGFSDIGKFLVTLKFAGFKLAVEQRKKLAKRLKNLEATSRETAKALGVSHQTINNDLAGNNLPSKGKKGKKNSVESEPSGNNLPSWFEDTPAAIAKAAEKRAKAPERRTERLENIEEISKGNASLTTSRRYPIILADPPWRYENPPIGGSNRSIENHYPTMTLDEICALPVADIAADAALLYLWATAPKLAECLDVVRAWGFEYRTNLVWVKDKIGMGYHARSQHELLLVCKRGEMPPPEAGTQSSSVLFSDRGEHSEKPPVFHELIERLYPDIGKIELFSRKPRAGWDSWGNQAEAAA